jgi:hypothetical protein
MCSCVVPCGGGAGSSSRDGAGGDERGSYVRPCGVLPNIVEGRPAFYYVVRVGVVLPFSFLSCFCELSSLAGLR